MGIASLILALVPAVAAKTRQPQPEKSKRERELEQQVETLTFALDYQREAASILQAQNERLIHERDELRRERNQLDLDCTCVPSRALHNQPNNPCKR